MRIVTVFNGTQLYSSAPPRLVANSLVVFEDKTKFDFLTGGGIGRGVGVIRVPEDKVLDSDVSSDEVKIYDVEQQGDNVYAITLRQQPKAPGQPKRGPKLGTSCNARRFS